MFGWLRYHTWAVGGRGSVVVARKVGLSVSSEDRGGGFVSR